MHYGKVVMGGGSYAFGEKYHFHFHFFKVLPQIPFVCKQIEDQENSYFSDLNAFFPNWVIFHKCSNNKYDLGFAQIQAEETPGTDFTSWPPDRQEAGFVQVCPALAS